MRPVTIRLELLALLLGVAVSGCILPDVDLDGRPCPCVEGWVCDGRTSTCVRPGEDGGMPDAPSDTTVADAPVGDTRGDTALDACTVASVTEEWGDRPTSDHPGTVLDTWINLNREHNATSTDLRLYTWPTAQIANAIIVKWNLSAIPAGATIDSATLHLRQSDAVGATYRTTAHRITGCDPDISGDQVDGYQCSATEDWTPNACCNDGAPMGQANIATADDTQSLDAMNVDRTWNVTDMVRRWVADPSTNLGMMINSDPTAPADDQRTFRSSEHAAAAERPSLVVTYGACD